MLFADDTYILHSSKEIENIENTFSIEMYKNNNHRIELTDNVNFKYLLVVI